VTNIFIAAFLFYEFAMMHNKFLAIYVIDPKNMSEFYPNN